MKLSELSPTARKKIEGLRYDRIIEKHEGPENWSSVLRFHEAEFMRIRNKDVLLPIGRDRHENITVLRFIESSDGNTLTLFLKDSTFVEDTELEWWQAGFIAICERAPREQFFVATVYHEWFIIDPLPPDGDCDFLLGSSYTLLHELNQIRTMSDIDLDQVPPRYELMRSDPKAWFRSEIQLENDEDFIRWVWRGLRDAAELSIKENAPIFGGD